MCTDDRPSRASEFDVSNSSWTGEGAAKRSQAGRGSQNPRAECEEPEKVLRHQQLPGSALHTLTANQVRPQTQFSGWGWADAPESSTELKDWPYLEGTAFYATVHHLNN